MLTGVVSADILDPDLSMGRTHWYHNHHHGGTLDQMKAFFNFNIPSADLDPFFAWTHTKKDFALQKSFNMLLKNFLALFAIAGMAAALPAEEFEAREFALDERVPPPPPSSPSSPA
ncbi:hypothetical protein N7451_007784 [Penicillium sp. IBT 35674x]|nr:hypothetical protein N7451_007784 [Penicillium sp. IBT 35674x]